MVLNNIKLQYKLHLFTEQVLLSHTIIFNIVLSFCSYFQFYFAIFKEKTSLICFFWTQVHPPDLYICTPTRCQWSSTSDL